LLLYLWPTYIGEQGGIACRVAKLAQSLAITNLVIIGHFVVTANNGKQ
jgi:hypothetical protein